jgi:hypothetical protein
MRKKQNSNPTTTAKHSISALPPAKQPLTNLQQNSLAVLAQQDTVAIVATTTAKPFRFRGATSFFLLLSLSV